MEKWQIIHEVFDDTTRFGNIKRDMSDETIDKISNTNKETWNNQSLRDNQSERVKEFWRRPEYRERKLAQIRNDPDDLIKRFRVVHGDKYDYSNMNYHGVHKNIVITCPIHGDFEMTPKKHEGSSIERRPRKPVGCEKCIGEAVVAQFIEKHGYKYDYSKVDLITCAKYSSVKEVTIICKVHGEFEKTPYLRKKGGNCPRCVAIQSGKTRRGRRLNRKEKI